MIAYHYMIIIIEKYLDYWMKINYGLERKEYQYINIKKKVFAEVF